MNLQPTVDSAISQTGQSAPNFVVQEHRLEPGHVLTLLLLTVEQIVSGRRLKLKLAKSGIVPVTVDVFFS